MSKKTLYELLAAAAIALAAESASAQDLTVFWGEWDPANYLQELVSEYTAETGVTVWSCPCLTGQSAIALGLG